MEIHVKKNSLGMSQLEYVKDPTPKENIWNHIPILGSFANE